MVIDTNNINNASASSARSRSAAPVAATTTPSTPQPATEAPAASGSNNVVLSQEAQSLARLQAKISSLPDVNMQRVAAIKQAIAEGRFEVNPDRIAENMLNQDELLG